MPVVLRERTPVPERTQLLRQIGLIDAPTEAIFDSIVEMAAQALGVPMAAIALLDERQQWQLAQFGFDAGETPIAEAMAGFALSSEQLIVADATQDERLADRSWVKEEPNIRFFAAHRLVGPGQVPIGALCVMDRRSRKLTVPQQRLLEILTGHINELFEQRAQTIKLASSSRADRRFQKQTLLALDANRATVIELDVREDRAVFDPAWERLLGYEPGTFPKTFSGWKEQIYGPDQHRLETILCSPQSIFETDFRVARRHGGVIWVRWGGKITDRDTVGRALKMVGMAQDVTEHWRRAASERESYERCASAVQAMQEGLVVRDAWGKILHANASAYRILGLCPPADEGHPGEFNLSMVNEMGEPLASNEDPASIALQTGEPQREVVIGVATGSDRPCWISMNAEPLFLPGATDPESVVTTFSDISDRIALQNQIQQHMQMIGDANVQLEIQRQQLEDANRRLEELATCDGLTGLRNHRFFQERLLTHFDNGDEVSLVLLDVDNFKKFNDTFGHPAGDAVLKQVAGALSVCARQDDIVARYGGEEFAVILPGVGHAEALLAAERIRAQIAGSDWPLRPVTASIGVATKCAAFRTAAELVAAADRGLYHSKEGGRNRVTGAEENSDTPKAA